MKKIIFYVLFVNLFLHAQEAIFRFPQKDPKGPKIAVVTTLIGEAYQKKMAFCTQTKIEYCKRNGYDLILGKDPITACYGVSTDCKRHPAWEKIPLVCKYLDQYDWIFHLDADTIVMNYNTRIEDVINEEYDFLGASIVLNRSEPMSLSYPDLLCTGTWLIKNSLPAKQFLLNSWTAGEGTKYCMKPDWEQPIMFDVLNGIVKGSVDIPLKWGAYPANVFNCNQKQYRYGDFIIHFYGLHGEKEKRYINIWWKRQREIIKKLDS